MTDAATRICKICGVEKPLEESFYKAGANKKGQPYYKSECKACDNARRLQIDREKRMPMHSVDVRYNKTQHDLPPTSDIAAVEETLDKTAPGVLESGLPTLTDGEIYNAAQTIVSCGDELKAVQRELDDTKAMLREVEEKYAVVKSRWLQAVKVIQGHGATDRNE